MSPFLCEKNGKDQCHICNGGNPTATRKVDIHTALIKSKVPILSWNRNVHK